MHRLPRFDVRLQTASPFMRAAAQCLFGAACATAAITVRLALDLLAPTASSFSHVYPTVLLATLYGHWRGGLVAGALSFGWAWYFLLPVRGSFAFAQQAELSQFLINAVSICIVALLAESYRRMGATAMAERDAQIERRIMLMHEIEHRTKNNFALVVSLLQLQARRESDPGAVRALRLATARIHSFARAYANLAESHSEHEIVDVARYIREVVTHFSDGGLHDGILVTCNAADCRLPRDVTLAIGLFINEALTNSAKYAFPEGCSGRIAVRFEPLGEGWQLTIADDGIGTVESAPGIAGGGHGAALLKAFAQQAQAECEIQTSPTGRTVRLTSA